MRKMMILLMLLALMASLACTTMAAESGVSMSDGGGQPGQTVYLAVELNESVMGDSVGLSYSFDSAVLEAAPASCSWSVQGVLQDFNNNCQGVWAADKPKDLKGTLCVLAFKIRSGIKFTSTTVSCTVVIQNGTAEVDEFTAQAEVSLACSHEYGDFADQGAIGHSRECSLCGGKQTQDHKWDEGVVKDNPNSQEMDWKVFTCTVCGGTQTYGVPASELVKPTEPTAPPQTYPSLPVAPDETEPERNPGYTQPTNPNRGEGDNSHQNNDEGHDDEHDHENPFRDYNAPQEPTDEAGNVIHSGDDHVHAEEELPMIIQSNDSGEDHDHDHNTTLETVTTQQRAGNFLLVVVVLAAIIAGGVFYMKKKK